MTIEVRSSQYNNKREKASSGDNSFKASEGILIKSKSISKEEESRSNYEEGDFNKSALNLLEGLMADCKCLLFE
jgi:hypothetical protein